MSWLCDLWRSIYACAVPPRPACTPMPKVPRRMTPAQQTNAYRDLVARQPGGYEFLQQHDRDEAARKHRQKVERALRRIARGMVSRHRDRRRGA